jgi:nucleoside-diphosphate-sugar epimerase
VDVLVTGGNGFVGRNLVDALLARGDRVRVLALPDEDVGGLEERGVAVFRGDVCRSETLHDPMRGVQGVVHLAAMMHVWRPLADYHAVNVVGTANVARAVLAAGARRLVHMSSSSVYGRSRRLPVDESFPLAPFDDPYPVTKAAGDRLVRDLAAAEGLPVVVLRPDQIFGPGDRLHFGATVARVRSGRGIVVGRGTNAIPLVYVADVVTALMLGLDRDGVTGEAFNITNDAPLTQREFLDAIASAIGVPPPRRTVPYHALYAAACVAERIPISEYTWVRPPLTRLGVAFLGTDARFSIDKARAWLGFEPRVPLREAVRLTVSADHDGDGARPGLAAQPVAS